MNAILLRTVVLCVALLLCAPEPIVQAAGIVGLGTPASCTDAALDAALVGSGLVTFRCGDEAVIDISIGTGTKVIALDTVVDGAGRITLSGGSRARVFAVEPGTTLMINNLTVADGYAADSVPGTEAGGAIDSAGTLIIDNSTFVENAGGIGGAIHNTGTATITNSTFSSNTSAVWGGAIDNIGALTISSSTFSANVGGLGGAIFTGPGSTQVTNSTFVDNVAGVSGGAISNLYGGSGSLRVMNSTFSGNNTTTIASVPPTTLVNTILADTRWGSNCFGSIIDGGHNLEDGTSCAFSPINGSLSSTAPQLDPAGLRKNGGPTETVALCGALGVPDGCGAASPALDAGDPAVCVAAPVHNLDQRGFVRPAADHGRCSIGAYEALAAPPETCAGDCDTSRTVTVDELVQAVNIALRSRPASECAALDRNDDGAATVDELVAAVSNSLDGCEAGGQFVALTSALVPSRNGWGRLPDISVVDGCTAEARSTQR